jgi:hypothetical protein
MVCAGFDVAACDADCASSTSFFAAEGCLSEFDAMNTCLGYLQVTDFVCFDPNKPVQMAGLCSAQIMAYEDCFATL